MDSSVNVTNTTQATTLCDVARKVIETPGLIVLLIFDFIVAIFAIGLNFLLFCSVWKVTLFHMNLRIAFAHVSLVAIWYCASCVAKGVYLLTALLNSDPCSLITSVYDCKLREISFAWSSQALMYSCSCVTLERLYCTLRYKSNYHGFPLLAMIFVPLCYVLPVSYTVKGLLTKSIGSVPVCESLLSITFDLAKISLSINASYTVASIILVCFLHSYNYRKLNTMLTNRAITHSLSSRFQLDQNLQLTRIIGPSAILEFITFVPNYIFLLLVVVGLDLSYELKIVMIQCNTFWKISFCFAYPLIAFGRNVHLRRGLIKVPPMFLKRILCKKNAVATIEVIKPKGLPTTRSCAADRAHFEFLEQSWKNARK